MSEQTDKPKKRKRRWGRYSLRTFLLLLTGFGVWLGLLVHRVNKQKEAVQWVREQGGEVYYDFEWSLEENLITNPQPPGFDWLRELIGIDYFADVVLVYLSLSEVEELVPLQNLPQLQGLALTNTPTSDIRPLAELTYLQGVNLQGTQVSDLSPLVGLKDLVIICLDWNQQVKVPEELKDRIERLPHYK